MICIGARMPGVGCLKPKQIDLPKQNCRQEVGGLRHREQSPSPSSSTYNASLITRTYSEWSISNSSRRKTALRVCVLIICIYLIAGDLVLLRLVYPSSRQSSAKPYSAMSSEWDHPLSFSHREGKKGTPHDACKKRNLGGGPLLL